MNAGEDHIIPGSMYTEAQAVWTAVHLDGVLQLGVVQHEVKAASAHGDQLPQDDVLTHTLHPVLLSKHGRPATLLPSRSRQGLTKAQLQDLVLNMHGGRTPHIHTQSLSLRSDGDQHIELI